MKSSTQVQSRSESGRREMRKHMLGTIAALLAVVLVAGAQTPGSEATRAALEKVTVTRDQGVVNVEMTTKGAVSPKVERLSSPDRLVVDLPNTMLATSGGSIAVGSEGVKGVRMGTDANSMTRVVVDLDGPSKFELVPGPGQKLTLKIGETARAQAPAAVAKAPVVAETQPKSSVTQEIATANAKDFVVVSPTYAPKKETSDPQEKAVDAASKFVERPEGSLLPQASGSLQAAQQSGAATAPAPSPAPAPSTIEPAVNLAAEQKTKSRPAASGPKYTGEPISVNLKDVDLKDFFRLIHEISGLNVVLDPDVKGSLTIVLDDVPWDQALDIVLKNNTLSRQLDGNVLRIASVDTMRKEAEARRAQAEAEALAVDTVTVTRFLSYAHSKDVVSTLKKFLSQRGHMESDDRTNAVIINDIPSVIPPIDRLLAQLDRKTQEVEIEARVVAATRSFARDIGTQLGFGWGNSPTGVGGATSVGASPVGVGNTGNPLYPIVSGGTGGVQIPLFSNLGAAAPTSGISLVNASNAVRLDAVLTMAESRGLLKILS